MGPQKPVYTHVRLLLFFLLFGSLSGCSKDDDIESFIPQDPDLSTNVEVMEVSNENKDYEVRVASNLPWRAESDVSWIQLDKQRGQQGETNLTLSIARNDFPTERSGTIKLWITDDYQKQMIINQKAGIVVDERTHYFVKADATGEGGSWADASSLDFALQESRGGDVIHLAAGIYTPTQTLTGGDPSNMMDRSFEISKNLELIGGYPENPVEGAEVDPVTNSTVLSGDLDGSSSYHVVAITAPQIPGEKVVLKGLSIENGFAQAGAGIVTATTVDYDRTRGGGIIVGGASVDLVDVKVSNNSSSGHAAGIYAFNGSVLTMNNVEVSNNIGTTNSSNAAGMFLQEASAYVNNSEFINNSAGGVAGAIQTFINANLYVVNSIIANNYSRHNGAGIYHRSGSRGYLINTLVYNNLSNSGRGGGIALYDNTSLQLISSTIANNSSGGGGGGIHIFPNGNMVDVYNSIIAGNSEVEGSQVGGNFVSQRSSVVGQDVYDYNQQIVSGAVFNYEEMLEKRDNLVLLPVPGENPALEYGMTADQLINLGLSLTPAVGEENMAVDLQEKSRSNGKVMGAFVLE